MSAAPEPARSSRVADLVAIVGLCAAVLWHLWPMLDPAYAATAIVGADTYRTHDWLEVAKFEHYARRAILDWKTLPLWNPLLAGGIAQFTHPSDGSTSPLILSSLVFGEVLGMKLNVALAALAGALGLFALQRRTLGLGTWAAFVGALVYAWSGWLPSRLAVGFYEVCLMAAFPAVLALWTAPGSTDDARKRWVLAALILWALAIQLQLAVPFLVLMMASLVFFTVAQQAARGEAVRRDMALGGLAIVAIAGLLGGLKFVPMLDALQAGKFRAITLYPTHPDAWYASFEQLWYGLFHRVPSNPLLDRDGAPRVQEYVTLLPGLGSLLLTVVGLRASLRRSSPLLPWTVTGLLFLWLCFGPHAPIDGFLPLSKLPLFSSMRGPLRYANWPVLVAIALCAALGFEQVQRQLARLAPLGGWRAPLLLLVGLIALNLPAAREGRDLYRSSFLYPLADLPSPDPVVSEGIKGISGGGSHALNLRKYINVRRGVPTIYDPEDLPMKVGALPRTRLDPNGEATLEVAYVGEAWLGTRGATTAPAAMGSASLDGYRAQRVRVSWVAHEDSTVMVNQNGVTGWTCGSYAISSAARTKWGLLGFDVPAGAGSVDCTWRPRLWWAGIAVSLLGWAALLMLWPWERASRTGRRTVAASSPRDGRR